MKIIVTTDPKGVTHRVELADVVIGEDGRVNLPCTAVRITSRTLHRPMIDLELRPVDGVLDLETVTVER